MLIIVEGPDGTGKTTFVNALATYLRDRTHDDVAVLKANVPKAHPLDEYVVPLLGYAPHGRWTVSDPTRRPTVVCDRWHLGELVYPQLFDRPTQLTIAAFRYVELFLTSRGAVVVQLVAAPDRLETVLAERGDDLVRPDQAKQMLDLFNEAALTSVLPMIVIDAYDTTDATLGYVVSQAIEQERVASQVRDFVTYVGTARPSCLLVGDVRGGHVGAHGRRPAFMPYKNTCGEYLLRAISTSLATASTRKTTFGELAIVNANDVDDLYSVWLRARRPPVVALGRLAARTVRRALPFEAGIVETPHPQYWKRFRYRDHEEYGNMITGSWEL